MGRQSRLKRRWRLERLSKQLEAGEFDAAEPVAPLSDGIKVAWVMSVLGTWFFSVAVIGAGGGLALGVAPFLFVVLVSSFIEKRRGRLGTSRIWLVAGLVWYVLVALGPAENLRALFPSLFDAWRG